MSTVTSPTDIGYDIVVTNTGNLPLDHMVLENVLPDGTHEFLTPVSGDTNGNGILDVGESWHYRTTYHVTQEDLDAGRNLNNNATVTSVAGVTAVSRMDAAVSSACPCTAVETDAGGAMGFLSSLLLMILIIFVAKQTERKTFRSTMSV